MVYIPTPEGYFISEDHRNIAEIVNDYDPNLFLAFIPEAKREPGDSPFAVIHREPSGKEYIALYAESCDYRILERLWAADNTKFKVLNEMEARNAAIEAVRLKDEMEKAAEKRDLAESILKSPLNRYTHNGVDYRG